MRVSKANFHTFLDNYEGAKSDVTAVRAAYQEVLNKQDDALKISSRRRRVPIGITEKNKEKRRYFDRAIPMPDLAKYKTTSVKVTRPTGLTNNWVRLQLKKRGFLTTQR